jgi:predicted TIM-barrel fold metal-dependent hydrolase
MPLLPRFPFRRPAGDWLTDDGAGGTSVERLATELLDAQGVDRAVLCHDDLRYTPAQQNTHLAREICRAANDWTLEQWVARDPRLSALMLVPNQVTDDAVTEIARIGDDPGMAGILMAVNGLSKPLGHAAYHPIYAAAADRGLPVVIHAGVDAANEVLTPHVAGGAPSFYGEYRALSALSVMTHVTSLIVQGVFEKFRDLQVLLMGAGVSWLPALLWRCDAEYVAYRREAPWVRHSPTEYFREHVRVGTWRMAAPAEPERLVRVLNTVEGVEDLLIYGSGFPDWDTSWPSELDSLPVEWRAKARGENAFEFFRWRASPAPSLVGGGDVGAMEIDEKAGA